MSVSPGTARAWRRVGIAEAHDDEQRPVLPSEDGALPSEMTPVEFEEAVGDALDLVPPALMDQLDNVVFLVEDEPPPEEPDLLGVYDGIPLTERDLTWGGHLPDRITIFRGPLVRMCQDREELLDEIAITVVHEIAHHFGIDDEALHELGWG